MLLTAKGERVRIQGRTMKELTSRRIHLAYFFLAAFIIFAGSAAARHVHKDKEAPTGSTSARQLKKEKETPADSTSATHVQREKKYPIDSALARHMKEGKQGLTVLRADPPVKVPTESTARHTKKKKKAPFKATPKTRHIKKKKKGPTESTQARHTKKEKKAPSESSPARHTKKEKKAPFTSTPATHIKKKKKAPTESTQARHTKKEKKASTESTPARHTKKEKKAPGKHKTEQTKCGCEESWKTTQNQACIIAEGKCLITGIFQSKLIGGRFPANFR